MSVRRVLLWLALAGALSAAACGDPPEKEMQQAQTAIESARAAGADEYSHDEFAGAEDALKRAREAVDQRDYRLALNNALDARERAQNAARDATDKKNAARANAERELLDAMTALNDAHAKLRAAETNRVPARTLAGPKREIAGSEQAVQKARAAFDKGDYPAALTASRQISARLRAMADQLTAASAAGPKRRR